MKNSNVAIPASNADAVFLIQCPIDTSLDTYRGVVYEKLSQAPRRCTDMLVEIDYIHQGFPPNE